MKTREVPVPEAGEAEGIEVPRSLWDRLPGWVGPVLFVALAVLVWQAAVWARVTSEFILPPPAEVGRQIGRMVGDMARGGFVLEHFLITVEEFLLGFVFSALAGISLGAAVAETAFGRRAVLPFLVAINAAPKVAFAPIFVAWLGFGIWAKVAMGAFIAFFPLMVDTAAGLASVGPEQARLFRSLRARRGQTFFKLKLPGALPFVFAGLKTAAVLSVVGAIVGEFLGGGAGFGQLIRIAGSQLRIARVFAFVTILSVAGYLFFAVVALVERKVVFWRSPEVLPGAGM